MKWLWDATMLALKLVVGLIVLAVFLVAVVGVMRGTANGTSSVGSSSSVDFTAIHATAMAVSPTAIPESTFSAIGEVASPTGVAATVPTQPPASPGFDNNVIRIGNWEYQVSKVAQAKSINGLFGTTYDAKGIWTIVQIKVQDIGRQTYTLNGWDFELRDSNGITYKTDDMQSDRYSEDKKLSNPGDSFPPGVPAEIGLVFDTNPAASGLKLHIMQADRLVDLGIGATPAPPVAQGGTSQNFDSIAGGWVRHGFTLSIDKSGKGTAQWRTYVWCKDNDKVPCDTNDAKGIGYGGNAEIQFNRVDEVGAYGRVTQSNDPSGFPVGGSVKLLLGHYDIGDLWTGSGPFGTVCGPKFDQEAPKEVKDTFPCGA